MDMPRVLAVDLHDPDPDVVEMAAHALWNGELVVLPTETVYGLCAHPDQTQAIRSIYHVKTRDDAKPLACLACNVNQVRAAGATFNEEAERLARDFWPGALTLVLPVGSKTQGFRVPDHAVPCCVMSRLGGPMVATSANRSGNPATTTAQDAISQVGNSVSLVLDGGPCKGKKESTVVSTMNGTLKVLREGAISRKQLCGTA